MASYFSTRRILLSWSEKFTFLKNEQITRYQKDNMPKVIINNFIPFLLSYSVAPSFSYHAILKIESFPFFFFSFLKSTFSTKQPGYSDGCPSFCKIKVLGRKGEDSVMISLFCLLPIFYLHTLLSAKANIHFFQQ